MSHTSRLEIALASLPVTRTKWKPVKQMMNNVLTHDWCNVHICVERANRHHATTLGRLSLSKLLVKG